MVAEQSAYYGNNLPDFLQPPAGSLPFYYESTGIETFFRDERDPEPRSRRVFGFHRPDTLLSFLSEPNTLRGRLRTLPDLPTDGMRGCQIEAITSLEKSFAAADPRALIQMATGAGKTYTSCAFIYRLITYAGARRVLFLVDRANLGRFLVGLTATPSKQTIGFFNQNLVTEYNHERAVADGVNVGYDVYRIHTEVTGQGATVHKGFYVDKRHRETRVRRWEQLDEDLTYGASEIDRSVVVPSQIRTVLQAFKDALFTSRRPLRALAGTEGCGRRQFSSDQ